MERDLAKHVVAIALKTMGELSDLLELVKEHCDKAEYAAYVDGVADVCGRISTKIMSKALSGHLDLEKEVEDKIKKYGKLI
jgi:phytoene/squalene synthetase